MNAISISLRHAVARWMMFSAVLLSLSCTAHAQADTEAPDGNELFAKDNLVAWCIVPFDDRDRTPEQRAVMLKELGIRRYAYDYRPQHIPQFEEELEAIKRHGIELTGWWFPGTLNDEARHILALLKKHNVQTQLWVSGGGPPTTSAAEQQQRVADEVARLAPIADAAAEVGCRLELYNHGGWFGEPRNQLALIEALNRDNVGIVYNLHHAHDQLDAFAENLQLMMPHLDVVNLNGMTTAGDPGQTKILPIGSGEHDVQLLKTLRDSGFSGPVGILNHTQQNAADRLQDNLDGLAWVVAQLDGAAAPPLPEWRTFSQVESESLQVAQAIVSASARGNPARGAVLFSAATSACLSCHQVREHGGQLGPELTAVAGKRSREEIVRSVLWPQHAIEEAYQAIAVLTIDGEVVRGYRHAAEPRSQAEPQLPTEGEAIVLRDSSTGQLRSIASEDVEQIQNVGSLMPDGLLATFSRHDRSDLFAFLFQLGSSDADPNLKNFSGTRLSAAAIDSLLKHAHGHHPATFPYERPPLQPQAWPSWQAEVNRDRLYDFYAKQARYFRTQQPTPMLLAEYPGLDGGTQGHWGNQDEASWADGRWNETVLGSVQSGVFRDGSKTVMRGVCVRVFPHDPQASAAPLAVCFDPDTLTYASAWTGEFLEFSAVRHGFMEGVKPAGPPVELPPQTLPFDATAPRTYLGYYRFGKRTAFAYRVGDIEYLDAPVIVDGSFQRIIAPRDQHPDSEQIAAGSPQWPQELPVSSQLNASVSGAYSVDKIGLPFDNPWKALLFCGGHDFMSDGSAMVGTMQGDIWHVTGLNESLDAVRWRRVAAGLHQTLGLVVHDDQVYALGRDQITRLHDLNDDGEFDYYECFSQAVGSSPGGHDFVCGLERDAQGRFYTASGMAGLLRISADGREATVLAQGLRNADGLGLLPDGSLTVPSSEGDWVPASMIGLVRPEGPVLNRLAQTHETGPRDRGDTVPFFGYAGREGVTPDLPLLYLPRGLDNQGGGQVAIDSPQWKALQNRVLHLSFGSGRVFLLLTDDQGDWVQGAATPLTGELASGIHRGRFHPHDGHLYVSGMAGWGTYTTDDGCFQRVRWTDPQANVPVGFRVHQNGIQVQFSQPLDCQTAQIATNHFAQCWNYRYSRNYGSSEYSARRLGIRGHDVLPIDAATVSDDGRSLFLSLPDLQPVNQLQLLIESSPGELHDLFLSVHHLGPDFTDLPDYVPSEKTVMPHPLLADMHRSATAVANPYREAIAGARDVLIETGSNLSFRQQELRVRAGEVLRMTLQNPDVVPHNWALIKPGTLPQVGQLTNRLIADPDAAARQYIPQSDDILAYTDVVEPGAEFVIYFKAPQQPGRYPYLCTFPGHWMVMNGTMIVEP